MTIGWKFHLSIRFLEGVGCKSLHRKEGLDLCFVDLQKAFDGVPRRVIEWALRRRGVPEALAKAVMKMYEGAMTKAGCGNTFSESFPVEVGVHQGSALTAILFHRD